MARIEDYGLIGDLQTAALVGRDGSIDWACFPRFDSGACFAALLGTPEHGRWLLAPRTDAWEGKRQYRPRTLVLETEWETDTGAVRVIDFMPPRGKAPDIVRIVEGLARPRRDVLRARHPLRLRRHDPVGPADRRRPHRGRRARTRSASARPSSIAARTCARSASSPYEEANASPSR